MTQIIKSRKERANFTIEQKLDYAKLMVNENYSNKKIVAISGAGPSAVTRWKKQYLAEISGQTPKSSKAMTPEQQEIQSLKKQLWRSQRDNEILKKSNSLVRSGQSKHIMIAKMNRACKQYKTKELCQLLKLPRSSYYYQVKDKSLNDNINAMIKFIKQTAIEVGHTYGKRRMRVSLNSRPLKTTPNKPNPSIFPTI
ncbi:hypothetical protein [uncultured Gammaproteobacteria bacterium]|nr:hypothetical protein [uncultured Gammaproteobacteria bacterium]CAC9659360.1 hypothetical protein [uncultured Gammaproteobacteria bacterium]CAC9983592.1 hypothetical protein [uncultured Gammaproteobacteria bacterium]